MASGVQTVQVTIGSNVYNAVYNSGTGKWEATLTAPNQTSYNQPGGYFAVQVKAIDRAGNQTVRDGTTDPNLRLVVHERVAPTIVITSPATGARVTSAQPTIVGQLRDEDGGSGIDLSTFAISVDGGPAVGQGSPGLNFTQVPGGYDFTYVVQQALDQGSHSVTVNVRDHDGNAAVQCVTSFTVDTTAPTLNVTSPTEGQFINTPTFTVRGQTNDALSSPVTVTITVNGVDQGAVTVNGDGTFAKDVTLAEGSNTLRIRAADAAGLYTEILRTVTLDTVAPTITSVNIAPNPADAGATLTITVTVADS